jgi:trans-2,3-dihydro-3-hydroxyanthranilate isomerase
VFGLLLVWDFAGKPRELFGRLRAYIRDESWARYAGRKGLRQKVWFSDEESGRWGAFYLWESREDLEHEVRTMGRVEAMTGVAPQVYRFEVEAVQEGSHSGPDLLAVGLAMAAHGGRARPNR